MNVELIQEDDSVSQVVLYDLDLGGWDFSQKILATTGDSWPPPKLTALAPVNKVPFARLKMVRMHAMFGCVTPLIALFSNNSTPSFSNSTQLWYWPEAQFVTTVNAQTYNSPNTFLSPKPIDYWVQSDQVYYSVFRLIGGTVGTPVFMPAPNTAAQVGNTTSKICVQLTFRGTN